VVTFCSGARFRVSCKGKGITSGIRQMMLAVVVLLPRVGDGPDPGDSGGDFTVMRRLRLRATVADPLCRSRAARFQAVKQQMRQSV